MRALSLSIAALLFVGPALADDIGLIAKDIRHSERMIRAAMTTSDVDELKNQFGKLEQIGARIMATTQKGDTRRISCGIAAGQLANVVRDVNFTPARALVAIEDDDRQYQEFMADCERAIRDGEKLPRRR